jgi:hypothetical protein
MSTNRFIRELTASIAVKKLHDHAFERELRSESLRWAWSVAVWEMMHPPADVVEIEVLAVELPGIDMVS